MIIDVKDWPVKGMRSYGSEAVPYDFLGEEGVRELETRVHSTGWVELSRDEVEQWSPD